MSTQPIEYELSRPLASAMRATAPWVGIPIPGRAPLIFERQRLTRALAGVTVFYVDAAEDSLKVEGTAGDGRVRTKLRILSATQRWDVRVALYAWRKSAQPKPKAERNKLAKFDTAIKRLRRELDKLGDEPVVWNVELHPMHTASERERENLVTWYRSKAIRGKVGALAAQYWRGGWRATQVDLIPVGRKRKADDTVQPRELYQRVEALGLKVRRYSELNKVEQERCPSFHDYTRELYRFCGLGPFWYWTNREMFYRDTKSAADPEHWGIQRYQARLEWRKQTAALQSQIAEVEKLREEAGR